MATDAATDDVHRGRAGWSAHLFTKLVYAQKRRFIGRAIRVLLRVRGTDIPPEVLNGRGLTLPHTGQGIVVHGTARIHDDVILFPNSMIVRGRPWLHPDDDRGRVTVEPLAIVGVGAVIAPTRGDLVVGRGTMIGANAVLTRSTGPWEIWAGVPARPVGKRPEVDGYA